MPRRAQPDGRNAARLLPSLKGDRHASKTVMTRLSPEALFRRSRVYAQGWNAARAWSLRRGPAPVKAVTNPYSAEPEQSRWNEGYTAALESYRAGPKFIPGQISGGPEAKRQ
jgi:hypothetical protein